MSPSVRWPKHIAEAIAVRRLTIGQNYILLVDMINPLCDEGKGTDEALMEAYPIRIRPVLVPSLTVVLALALAALGQGPVLTLMAPGRCRDRRPGQFNPVDPGCDPFGLFVGGAPDKQISSVRYSINGARKSRTSGMSSRCSVNVTRQ